MTVVWKLWKRYWRIPVLIVLGVAGLVLWKRWSRDSGVTPFAQVAKELEAIRAGVEVDKLKAELGHTEALKHIDDQYAAEMQEMDDAQAEEAERLRKDPEALTRFIMRSSG